jgi:hypothetical protein
VSGNRSIRVDMSNGEINTCSKVEIEDVNSPMLCESSDCNLFVYAVAFLNFCSTYNEAEHDRLNEHSKEFGYFFKQTLKLFSDALHNELIPEQNVFYFFGDDSYGARIVFYKFITGRIVGYRLKFSEMSSYSQEYLKYIQTEQSHDLDKCESTKKEITLLNQLMQSKKIPVVIAIIAAILIIYPAISVIHTLRNFLLPIFDLVKYFATFSVIEMFGLSLAVVSIILFHKNYRINVESKQGDSVCLNDSTKGNDSDAEPNRSILLESMKNSDGSPLLQ